LHEKIDRLEGEKGGLELMYRKVRIDKMELQELANELISEFSDDVRNLYTRLYPNGDIAKNFIDIHSKKLEEYQRKVDIIGGKIDVKR
jgi:hypothetical protein